MEQQNNSKTSKFLLILFLIVVLVGLVFVTYKYKDQIKRFMGFATVTDFFLLRAMDQGWTTTGHAWGENIGWISFQEDNGGIYVGDYQLLGYAWGENIGWVSLNCLNTDSCGTVDYAVLNDGEGTLSGYAWGENIGWIHFAPTNGGVTIGADGVFSGYAWGENVGWINFEATGSVSTTWRHQSDRDICNNGLDDDSDGHIDYPNDVGCYALDDTRETSSGQASGGPSGSNLTTVPSGGDSTNTTDATSTDNTNTTSTTTVPVATSTPSSGPSDVEPTTNPGQNQGQVAFTGKFTRDLTVGDVGEDVNSLQKFLNDNGFVLSLSGAGSPGNETMFFGNRTKDSLRKYQEAYAEFILAPLGLTEGTGYFGGLSRSYINALLGE